MSNAQRYYTTSYSNCNNFTTPNLYLNNYTEISQNKDKIHYYCYNSEFIILGIVVIFIQII